MDRKMKDMTSFTKEHLLSEARRGAAPEEVSDNKVVTNGKVENKDKVFKQADKPNAAKRLNWAVDEPTDNDVTKYANRDDWDDNMIAIRGCLKSKKPFFIIGHSGWGKTEVIKSVAKKFGYTIITVYLDKACAEDLGGIPVPMEKNGSVYQELALPGWAAYILDNPDKKFLLFFDEMNQADPYVMNALMPIVKDNVVGNVKIKNYLACAAGNYKDENSATHELSDPLEQRFVYLVWEDKTPESWASNFKNFMHPKWDPLVGKDLVDELEKNCKLFKSPRIIDQKILETLWEIKKEGPEEWDFYTPKFYMKILDRNTEDNLSMSEKKDVEKLAEYFESWMHNDPESKKNNRSRDALEAPDDLKEQIRQGMEFGWIMGDDWDENHTKWAFARDILPDLFYMDDWQDTGESITMEQINQVVKMFEKKGIKFKYDTAKQALSDDPTLSVEDEVKKRLGI